MFDLLKTRFKMKKGLVFFGVLLLLLVITPFILKNYLIRKELEKVKIEKGVSITYQSSSLSLLSFPTLKIGLSEVVIENDKFEKQPLVAKFHSIDVGAGLSVLFTDSPTVKFVTVTDGEISLFIDKEGKRNFDFSGVKKEGKKKKDISIEQLLVENININYLDESKNQKANAVLNTVDWKDIGNVSVSSDLLLKEFLIDGKVYYSDKSIKTQGLYKHKDGKITPQKIDVEVGQLKLAVNPVGKFGWHIFSDKAKIEDYFEVLPDFIRPNAKNYSSNTPLFLDVSIDRKQVKLAEITANHLVLKNIKTSKQIDEINFTYTSKKRDCKLTDLVFRGLESSVTGSHLVKNLREHEIESFLFGDLDITNLVKFFYPERYLGLGKVKFNTAISKRSERLDGAIDFNQVAIINKKGEIVSKIDGGLTLNAKTMLFNRLVINPGTENVVLNGLINQPINFFLLNKKPTTGEFAITSTALKMYGQQCEDINLKFDFGILPSTEFLYLGGLPFNPMVSPTFFRVSEFNFVETSVNKDPVHLELFYETDEHMHLKDFTYKIGDTLFKMEVFSEKPHSLALFAFEKQKFHIKCNYEHFKLSEMLRRVGVSSDKHALIDGTFESWVSYQPMQLVSKNGLTDILFNDIMMDLSINEEQIKASGNAIYEDNKVELKKVKIPEGDTDLLKGFLKSLF